MAKDQIFNSGIKALCFDVDGVLTDGGMLITENGDHLRRMNTKDGFAMKMAVKNGFPVGIITGGNSQGVVKRLKRLGIEDIHAGVDHKLPTFLQWCKKHQISADEVLFTGDDIPDIEIIDACGVAACPSDAVSEIKDRVDYISPLNGGMGCVRDVIRKFLIAHDKWNY